MKTTVRFKIFGRVQGVGYRYFTLKTAIHLNIAGTVRNLPDGTVEVIAQGDPEHIEKFFQSLLKGPLLAAVQRIEREVLDSESTVYQTFSITH